MTIEINDICDSIVTKIKGITPTVESGWPFYHANGDGSQPIEETATDDRFDRSFRVVAFGDPIGSKTWGTSLREMQQTVLIQVAYKGREDDYSLLERINADSKDIRGALFTGGLDWPSCLSNIQLESMATRQDLSGGGRDLLIWNQTVTITFDEEY